MSQWPSTLRRLWRAAGVDNHHSRSGPFSYRALSRSNPRTGGVVETCNSQSPPSYPKRAGIGTQLRQRVDRPRTACPVAAGDSHLRVGSASVEHRRRIGNAAPRSRVGAIDDPRLAPTVELAQGLVGNSHRCSTGGGLGLVSPFQLLAQWYRKPPGWVDPRQFGLGAVSSRRAPCW